MLKTHPNAAIHEAKLANLFFALMNLDMMKRTIALITLLATWSVPGYAQQDIQFSHIEANVPPESAFSPFLKRDLLAYFRGAGFGTAKSITYKLLRDAPTQSGVAYPKYYAWVQVFDGEKLLAQGAVRLAAIERTHFKVTDFISKAQLNANPGKADDVFPATLVSTVISMAK